jgi:hypothetical protein
MQFEIPGPRMTFEVPLEDGAKIRMRRHGNPDGVRLLVTHGNGFAANCIRTSNWARTSDTTTSIFANIDHCLV